VRGLSRGVFTLCLLVGLLFTGQGVGLIPRSFMTGRIEWAVIGAFLAALGAIGLWATTRRRV